MPENGLILKLLAGVAAAVLLAACGSSSTAVRPLSSASPGASASASPSTTPGLSPSPASPSASPAPVGSYAVLVTTGGTDTYAISLVDVNGKVVASAQPTSPTTVSCGDSAAAVVPLPVSTSNTRAYFLDQQGNVSFLTPNGETGHATHVPTGGSIRSLFTVSPDDQRIAVVEITYTTGGATTVLYVEDLNGGTNHVKLYTQAGAYTLWPIGWHGSNNLVLAKVPACTQGGGPFCCGPLELHVVDPATAARRFTLGGTQCVIAGSPSPAGAVCENTSSFTQATVLSWTATSLRTITIQGPTAAYLSPDGTAVALVSFGTGTTTFEGVKQTLSLDACGWIDGTHVIAGGDTQQQARIGDVTTGAIVPVAAQGVCGGIIPGSM